LELTDRDQIEEWFLSYKDSIHNFLVYFTGSHDVDDLVQETFMRAFHGLSKYNGKAKPKVWLCAIARNAAIDLARKKNRRKFLNEIPDDVADESVPVEDAVVVQDSTRELLALLDRLRPHYRDVILLRSLQQLSAVETAEILGWTQSNVNLTYHRALKQARELMYSQVEGEFVDDRG
jgi:RNA polymerase sigma-70 factor, ECF subfamily